MKPFFSRVMSIMNQVFDTKTSLSLKSCYKTLISLTILNFIVFIFWGINPFQWVEMASLLFDVLMVVYGIVMIILITILLIQRFNDAGIQNKQAMIYPIVMMILMILIRIRSFSQGWMILMLSIYFLSHFYLMMLVMMPTKRALESSEDDKSTF